MSYTRTPERKSRQASEREREREFNSHKVLSGVLGRVQMRKTLASYTGLADEYRSRMAYDGQCTCPIYNNPMEGNGVQRKAKKGKGCL